MTTTREIDKGLHIVDLKFQGQPGVIASFLIESEDGLAMVETGPTTTLPRLLDSLQPFGGTERLSTIVVTHVHLDHAGAAGHLLALAPFARLYVHEVGAPHLIDPSRLVRSASRIYGDAMDSLWGEVVGVPRDRVVAVSDGDTITVPGGELRAIYTPGHASHHIALHDPHRSSVFAGDVAGIRLTGFSHVRPATPPPDIDLGLWRESVEKIRSLAPDALLMTHFGAYVGHLDCHLDSLLGSLESWAETVRRGLEEGIDPARLVDVLSRADNAEVRAEGGTDADLRRYELATPYDMSVSGLTRYVNRRAA